MERPTRCRRAPAPGRVRTAKLAACALSFALTACSTAHYKINPPLTKPVASTSYATRNLAAPDNSDSLLVFLTLSGGGYRAAALGFAVMEAMRETSIRWEGRERNMLQEVDVISAVSGGSLVAGYYAARPDVFFEEFPQRVLGLDLQSALWRRALSPSGLWQQTSATYGRGDLLEELLTEHIFGATTYGDLPRRRPIAYINATDMRGGELFQFSQDSFDRLCSDLNGVPVARSVAASMAVPIVFSPITLWNHTDACPTERPRLTGLPPLRRYLHLIDGGLADNTGVRALLEIIRAGGGPDPAAHRAGLVGVRKRVFIVVDAQTGDATPSDDDRPDTPGLLQQMSAAVNLPVARLSESTLMHLGDTVRLWQRESRLEDAIGAPQRPEDRFYVIQISIAHATSVSAQATRQIETGLRLTPKQLEDIRAFARAELAAHPEWRRLLRDLEGARVEAAAPSTGGAEDDSAALDTRMVHAAPQTTAVPREHESIGRRR